jgi:hypothetical protein
MLLAGGDGTVIGCRNLLTGVRRPRRRVEPDILRFGALPYTKGSTSPNHDAAKKYDNGHNRGRHEQEYELLAVQLDLANSFVCHGLNGAQSSTFVHSWKGHPPCGNPTIRAETAGHASTGGG